MPTEHEWLEHMARHCDDVDQAFNKLTAELCNRPDDPIAITDVCRLAFLRAAVELTARMGATDALYTLVLALNTCRPADSPITIQGAGTPDADSMPRLH